MILAKFSSFYPKFAKTAYNAKRVRVLTHHFFKVCRTTRTPKVPKHGPFTIMRKNTIKKEFKRLKRNLKDLKMNKKLLLIINGYEVPIHPTLKRRQIARGLKIMRR